MKEQFSLAVIGLGSMGMGAAKSAINAGVAVYGADINHVALADLKAAGAKAVSQDARDFAKDVDALLLLVVNATQVKEILFGEKGIAEHLNAGTPVMISSTISSEDAKEIALKLQDLGLPMLDAPISGGSIKANLGQITVMASGDEATFNKMKPVLEAISEKVYVIGNEIGLGSTVKIIHQLLAGVHIAAGAEAMALAARANIPLDTMYDVVVNAAGNSWMFENRMKHVVDGDYSPKSAVDIFVKDLNLVRDTAKNLQFPLPLASTALNMFTEASNKGHGREDDSAVIKIFSGIELPNKQ